jgi:hypothetical protein
VGWRRHTTDHPPDGLTRRQLQALAQPHHRHRRRVAGVPEFAVAKARRWAESQTPPEHRDKMRVEIGVRGKSMTVFECRPPWDGSEGEWSRQPLAQIRFVEAKGTFTLHWADSNSRWHSYDEVEVLSSLAEILREIHEDPTCIFWG